MLFYFNKKLFSNKRKKKKKKETNIGRYLKSLCTQQAYQIAGSLAHRVRKYIITKPCQRLLINQPVRFSKKGFGSYKKGLQILTLIQLTKIIKINLIKIWKLEKKRFQTLTLIHTT